VATVTAAPLRERAPSDGGAWAKALEMSTFTAADPAGHLKKEIAEAIADGASAVIIVNVQDGADPDQVSVINAPYSVPYTPLAVPVVVVAPAAAALLAAPDAMVSTLHINGESVRNRKFRSVYARLAFTSGDSRAFCAGEGAWHTQPNVMITTPVSGWFTCGGERGPGVAVMLELARRIVAIGGPTAPPSAAQCYTYHFVANSGHEFTVPRGNLGLVLTMDTFAARGLGPAVTRVWLSLGASIATVDGPGKSAYGAPGMGALVAPHLVAAGFAPVLLDSASHGEVMAAHLAGYEVFGFFGAFSRFHQMADDSSSTSQAALAPALEAIYGGLLDVLGS
jgi:hypothetical protein